MNNNEQYMYGDKEAEELALLFSKTMTSELTKYFIKTLCNLHNIYVPTIIEKHDVRKFIETTIQISSPKRKWIQSIAAGEINLNDHDDAIFHEYVKIYETALDHCDAEIEERMIDFIHEYFETQRVAKM